MTLLESTDSVTSGRENKVIYISRFASKIPEDMKGLMDAVRGIERLIPSLFVLILNLPCRWTGAWLFFRYALSFNVYKKHSTKRVKRSDRFFKIRLSNICRAASASSRRDYFFGDMPDWNPAEIIGDRPNNLDYSLYDYPITDSAWHEVRTSQGYYNVAPAKLVELFGNKVYVNVRNTLNSFYAGFYLLCKQARKS